MGSDDPDYAQKENANARCKANPPCPVLTAEQLLRIAEDRDSVTTLPHPPTAADWCLCQYDVRNLELHVVQAGDIVIQGNMHALIGPLVVLRYLEWPSKVLVQALHNVRVGEESRKTHTSKDTSLLQKSLSVAHLA